MIEMALMSGAKQLLQMLQFMLNFDDETNKRLCILLQVLLHVQVRVFFRHLLLFLCSSVGNLAHLCSLQIEVGTQFLDHKCH